LGTALQDLAAGYDIGSRVMKAIASANSDRRGDKQKIYENPR
jgi:hypothetical protein